MADMEKPLLECESVGEGAQGSDGNEQPDHGATPQPVLSLPSSPSPSPGPSPGLSPSPGPSPARSSVRSPGRSPAARSPARSPAASPFAKAIKKIGSVRDLFKNSSLRSVDKGGAAERSDVYSWGWGLNGQLGVNVESASGFLAKGGTVSQPTKVTRLCVHRVVQVCCGSRCTFVLTSQGHVYSFGRGDDGQLGHDAQGGNLSTPRIVERLMTHTVVQVACKGSHVAAVSDEGELWTWGRGDEGQLGHGDTTSVFVPQRVQALADVGVVKVGVGRQHTAVLSEDGRVFVMGSGSDGQLGLGSASHALLPTVVSAQGLEGVVDIACGSRHTLALTAGGHVYAWGWNAYGQLGQGTTSSVFVPSLVSLPRPATELVCGFRHSFALTDTGAWYGWGWNQYGQLGHSTSHGVGHACERPVECSLLSALNTDVKLIAGGRHSIAITALGDVYTFGRGTDGQLGLGNTQDREQPTLVRAVQAQTAFTGGCGWAHSVVVFEPAEDDSGVVVGAQGKWISRGDWDAFFGVFFNVLINLLLITSLCQANVGLSAEFVVQRILPGAGISLGLGAAFFGFQCRALSGSRGFAATAQPFGLDTPIMLSTVFLLMAPYSADKGDPEGAWKLGLFSAVVIGTLQILGAFVGDWLRRIVPRAALLSALAGIGLGFIAESFMFQIYDNPVVTLVPMAVIWVAYAAGVTLPFGAPGSVVAVLLGTIVGYVTYGADMDYWKPPNDHVDSTPHFGHVSFNAIVDQVGSSYSWSQLALIVPLCVINIVGSLVNLEGAASVGDPYSTRWSMIVTGSCTLIGALFGNPFPCCIFLGHPAWKAVGAGASYAFMCAIAAVGFCWFNGVPALNNIMPIESTVPILLWVGLAVTAQAYEGAPNEKPQLLAVTVGLLPSLASWAQQLIGNYLGLLGKSYDDVQDKAASLYVHGMISFSQGFLLLAILLSSLMVYITDRQFDRAALACLCLSALSFFGFVHSYDFSESGNIEPQLGWATANVEAVSYLLSFGFLALLHLGGFSEDDSGTLTNKMRTFVQTATGLPQFLARRVRGQDTSPSAVQPADN